MNPLNMLRDMRTIKGLLEGAESIARVMGEEEPGAEHLLLAATDLPDGAASRILARFDVDDLGLRSAIEASHAEALATVGVAVDEAARLSRIPPLEASSGQSIYRSRPSAQEAFQAAGALARSSRERLSGAHVVAAVARMEHGTAARALERLGVDRAALAAAADAERGREPDSA